MNIPAGGKQTRMNAYAQNQTSRGHPGASSRRNISSQDGAFGGGNWQSGETEAKKRKTESNGKRTSGY